MAKRLELNPQPLATTIIRMVNYCQYIPLNSYMSKNRLAYTSRLISTKYGVGFWNYFGAVDFYANFQKFNVESWSKDLYGQFYNGDSYIVLNVCRPTYVYTYHFESNSCIIFSMCSLQYLPYLQECWSSKLYVQLVVVQKYSVAIKVICGSVHVQYIILLGLSDLYTLPRTLSPFCLSVRLFSVCLSRLWSVISVKFYIYAVSEVIRWVTIYINFCVFNDLLRSSMVKI